MKIEMLEDRCKYVRFVKLTIWVILFVPYFTISTIYSKEITETRLLLGTFVSLTVDLEGAKKFEPQVLDQAFLEIKRLESIFSTYVPDSDISILNEKGMLIGKNLELAQVLGRSLHFASISSGLFDITIKPVLDQYRWSYELERRAPRPHEIYRALSYVDHRNVLLYDDKIQFSRQGVQITTDGIAKGYIIDRIIGLFLKSGIASAMVNIGGDMRSMGKRWKVALQNPRDAHDYVVNIALKNQAVATSGDYERYFDPNKRARHIINPTTGRAATSLISATIVAATAMDADALATAVFVMGPQKGLDLIEKLDEVEALVITSDRRILASSGFNWMSKNDNVEIVRHR